MSTLIYTLEPAVRSRSLRTIPSAPMRSKSRALMISKPQALSCLRSYFLFATGARMPAWIEVFLIRPSSCAMCRNVPWLTALA